jgi:hypothetical protein
MTLEKCAVPLIYEPKWSLSRAWKGSLCSYRTTHLRKLFCCITLTKYITLPKKRRRNTQHNDTQENDIQHNDTQYERPTGDTQHQRHSAEQHSESSAIMYCHAECHILYIVMLNVIMLSVIRLNVVIQSVFRSNFTPPPPFKAIWSQCYKTLYGRNLQMFVISLNVLTSKPLQAYLKFARKAGAYQSKAPIKGYNLEQASGLTHKH